MVLMLKSSECGIIQKPMEKCYCVLLSEPGWYKRIGLAIKVHPHCSTVMFNSAVQKFISSELGQNVAHVDVLRMFVMGAL